MMKTKSKRRTKRRPNPLKLDPTRTATLRRAFAASLKKRFARLRFELRKLLIDEDAFGLVPRQQFGPLGNVYCPTGEGGGIDPTCSPGGGGQGIESGSSGSGGSAKEKNLAYINRVYRHLNTREGFAGGDDPKADEIGRVTQRIVEQDDKRVGVEEEVYALYESNYKGTDFYRGEGRSPTISIHPAKRKGVEGYEIEGPSKAWVAKTASKDEIEWAIYKAYRAKPPKDLKERMTRKPTANVLVLNDRWRFQPNAEKIKAFQQWLRQQFASQLIGKSDEELWEAYTEAGFKKGMGRAFDDTTRRERALAAGRERLDFYQGNREQFLRSSFGQPVAVEKVKLLAGRSFDDLENVTEDMAARMSRTLTDGLVQGKGPREIAREMDKDLDIGRTRALAISRTELIRAHASGQLTALENLGVEELNVMVEWVITDDEKVCDRCSELQGVVLKLSEAQGMIPRHVNCVSGDSIVECADAFAVLKAKYTGQIIQLVTAEGRRLTVTPNHILFTEFGFLPARFFYKGLKVLKAPFGNAGRGKAPNKNTRQASIADVFTTLAESGLMLFDTLPTLPVDFHGDGSSCDSEIEAIWPNCKLWSKGQNRIDKIVKERFPTFQLFGMRGVNNLPGRSSVASFLERSLATYDRSMGRFRDLLALLLGHLLHSQQHGFTAVSRLDSGILQSFVNGAAAAPEFFRECLRAHPLLKQFQDFSVGKIKIFLGCEAVAISSGFDIDPAASQSPCDCVLGNAEHISQFSGCATGLVEGNYFSVSFEPVRRDCGFHSGILADLGIDASFPQSQIYGSLIDAKVRRNVVGRLSRLVEFDDVVDVQVFHVDDFPVYDLQTKNSLCSVNGILSSQCRCTWIPANVGEDSDKQKDSKSTITDAIRQSQRLGGDEEDWGPGQAIAKERPESILNQELVEFSRFLHNVFCPTGEGGGVDPTCSPGGGSAMSSANQTADNFAKENPPKAGHEYVWRVQPKGMDIKGHKSMTSEDEPDERGIHVFGSLDEAKHASIAWGGGDEWQPEIVTIQIKEGRLEDTGDYEGYVIDPEKAEIVHRHSFDSWRDMKDYVRENK